MNPTADLRLQVDILAADRDAGTADVRVPGTQQVLRVPISCLDELDPYANWHVKTIVGHTPPAGAVLLDHAGRPRVRFYSDRPDVSHEDAARCAYDFLDHLREHYPGGI